VTGYNRLRDSQRIHIEQAIAFGRSVDWMTQHLGATDTDIDQAIRHMDAAVSEDNAVELIDRGVIFSTVTGKLVSPHGTRAAYHRHKAYGETPCELCIAAVRDYDRRRKAEERARKRGITSEVPRPGSAVA
jgi:hypothetical protein